VGKRGPSAAAIVFALLVLATVGAFAYAQRVKRDPLVLDRVTFGRADVNYFAPASGCEPTHMRIRFRMTQSDHATVQVIRPRGRVVKTLARDEFLKRYHFFTYFWNGRWPNGAFAPPGRYKLRVTLHDEDRTLIPPGYMKVRSAAAVSCVASPPATGSKP
jgi:hypothetical protein